MRKIVTLVLCLVLALSLVGCSKKMDKNTMLNDVEKLSSELQGKSRTEVHEVLGEPDGELFGLDGEIYYNSEDKSVIILYLENEVFRVHSAD